MSEIDELINFINYLEKGNNVKYHLIQTSFNDKWRTQTYHTDLLGLLQSFKKWQKEKHYGDK